jgi:hypothetical protein
MKIAAVVYALALSAFADRAAKLDAVTKSIVAAKYDTLPSFEGKDITSVSNLLKFSAESMAESCDRVSDELAVGRKKLIHPCGVAATTKFVAAKGTPYTGMFKGADSCIARLSLAANPSTVAFIPGMAIKCFRDNIDSGNIIAMYQLEGQAKNYNFFANSFSNAVKPPTSVTFKVVSKIFERASACPTHLSLKQFAEADQYGSTVSQPNFPFRLLMNPTADLQTKFSSEEHEFRDDLLSIPAGTVLWNVVSDNGTPMGTIETTGPFVASRYVDETLYFRHDRGEDQPGGCGHPL